MHAVSVADSTMQQLYAYYTQERSGVHAIEYDSVCALLQRNVDIHCNTHCCGTHSIHKLVLSPLSVTVLQRCHCSTVVCVQVLHDTLLQYRRYFMWSQ